MKLNANEASTLKVIVEGYENEELLKIYNRIEWGEPKTIRLSRFAKETLWAYFGECEFLNDEERKLIEKLCEEVR